MLMSMFKGLSLLLLEHDHQGQMWILSNGLSAAIGINLCVFSCVLRMWDTTDCFQMIHHRYTESMIPIHHSHKYGTWIKENLGSDLSSITSGYVESWETYLSSPSHQNLPSRCHQIMLSFILFWKSLQVQHWNAYAQLSTPSWHELEEDDLPTHRESLSCCT